MARKRKVRPASPPNRRPLAIHIVYQDVPLPADNSTRRLAKEIYARLVRGGRPSGVPIKIWTRTDEALSAPPLENAARNAVILLIDQRFFDSRKAWQSYFESLEARFQDGQDLLVPV